MKRTTALAYFVVAFALFAPASLRAQEGSPPPRRVPQLTNDDLRPSGGASRVQPDEGELRSAPATSEVRNPRAVLEDAFRKLAKAHSMRMQMVLSTPQGERQVTIESMKPDRMRMVSNEGEFIVVGRNAYYKLRDGQWQTTTSKTSPFGLDPDSFVKQLLSESGVSMSARLIGEQTIDGWETSVYSFELKDRNETAQVEACIDKAAGYIRKLSIGGAGAQVYMRFGNFNEEFTIDPPM
jgi:hypothetical protein